MADSPASDQSLYDEVEEAYVDMLEDERWTDIWADDLEGYGNPTDRDEHVPDIAADDGTTRLIVEVETETSEDEDQRQAFKDWANERYNREYRSILAKSGGTWTQFESVS